MGRDYVSILGVAAIGSLLLALCLVLAAVFFPFLLGGVEPETGIVATLKNLLPIAAMLLVILGGLLYIGVFLAVLCEIIVGKNDGNWKVIWSIVIIVLGIFGLAAYLAMGRKELRR